MISLVHPHQKFKKGMKLQMIAWVKKPVVISFHPLCGTGMVFDARVKNRNLNFEIALSKRYDH
jgi:hypothetical protein